jgi:hypothetical protein
MYAEGPINGMFSWDSDGAILCQYRGFKRILFNELGPSGRQAIARVIEQTTGNFFTMRQNVDQGSVGWVYQPAGGQTGYFYQAYNNNYLYGGFAISGARGTEGKGRAWLPRGVVISPDSSFSSGRHITYDSAAPTSSHDRKVWRTGDLVLNSNGASGNSVGWRCTNNGGWANKGAWAVSTVIETGDTVTGGGYLFRARSEPSASATGTAISGAEPSWPSTYGQTVTGADGIVWENCGVSGPTFDTVYYGASEQYHVGGNATMNSAVAVYEVNTAPATVTLQTSPTPSTGQKVTIKASSGTSGVSPLTITGTVDGTSNPTIVTPYESATLVYNGSSWSRI